MSIEVNMNTWNKIPKHLQQLFEAAVKWHSWEQYTQIQKADIEAFVKFQTVQKVEVIRLKEEDIAKFRRFAPALWVAWAKKSPLGMKAFKSQWEYMKSVKIGYYTEKDLVDPDGKKLEL
jgi:TRAP-type C4-dicarboxylate transport system substrate-binding protein